MMQMPCQYHTDVNNHDILCFTHPIPLSIDHVSGIEKMAFLTSWFIAEVGYCVKFPISIEIAENDT